MRAYLHLLTSTTLHYAHVLGCTFTLLSGQKNIAGSREHLPCKYDKESTNATRGYQDAG